MPEYFGTDGNDRIDGTSGADVFHTSKGDDILNGAGGVDTLIADFSARTIPGHHRIMVDDNGLNGFLLFGEAGQPNYSRTDFLGMEHFQLIGCALTDQIEVSLTRSIAGYSIDVDAGAGADSLDLDLSLGDHPALTGNAATSIGNAYLTFRNIETFHLKLGNGNDDVTLGANGADTVMCGWGDDRVIALGGDDVLEGEKGADYLDGGDGNDKLYSYNAYIAVDDGNEVDTLIGGAGDDLISFGYGDNADGGTGTDRLSLSLRGSASGVVLDLSTLFAGGTITIGGGTVRGFEGYDLIYGTEFGDTIATGDGGNLGSVLQSGIQGFGGDDLITTGSHADSIYGGTGNDTIHAGGDKDYLTGDEGNDTIFGDAGNDTIYGGPDNDELHGGDDDDVLNGDEGQDHLYGDAGNDTLTGGSGGDTMEGGAGNDTYSFGDGDTLVEAVGGGFDTVNTFHDSAHPQLDFILTPGAEIEVFRAGQNSGFYAINMTGNEFGQQIIANGKDNIIDGGGGADTMTGFAGNDVYIVDVAGDSVIEAANEGTDEIRTALAAYSLAALPNVENLTGTSNAGQSLTGNAAANVIRGGTGADTMTGGAGNDVYYVEAGDTVVELANEGIDEIRTGLAVYTLAALPNVENLTGTSNGGQSLTGNAAANVMHGGDGNDSIDGGAGADAMTGGGGDDVYMVDNAGDVVTELAGQGIDEVRTTLASYTLGANLDNLTGISSAGQSLTGNGGDNVIRGGGGRDALSGGAGNDILTGGAGQDRLTGGSGADVFVYTNVTDSVVEAWRSDGAKFLPDTILDFQSGVDRIDLSAIDAIAGTPGNDAFTFIGSAAFGHHAGELRAEIHDGYARIYADVDGDGAADMQITVHTTSLQAADFVL